MSNIFCINNVALLVDLALRWFAAKIESVVPATKTDYSPEMETYGDFEGELGATAVMGRRRKFSDIVYGPESSLVKSFRSRRFDQFHSLDGAVTDHCAADAARSLLAGLAGEEWVFLVSVDKSSDLCLI